MANRIEILGGQLKGKNPAKTHEKDKHQRQEINKPIKVVGDLLMIFDSNRTFLKPELTNTNIKSQHIHASKIDLACTTLQSCEFTVSPQKILINVDPNDLDNDSVDTLITKYDKLLKILHQRTPNSTIYISSILERKDLSVSNETKDLNG